MGGLKKVKTATPQAGTEKGKEIKIVTRHVITASDVLKNPRIVKLLYIISLAQDGISEKALAHLVYSMEKDAGVKLGYNFALLGGSPVSRELLNDLTSLKYTGLVEVSLKNKRLVLTGVGKEALERAVESIQSEVEAINKAFQEAWPKITPIDLEATLKASKR